VLLLLLLLLLLQLLGGSLPIWPWSIFLDGGYIFMDSAISMIASLVMIRLGGARR